MGLKRSMKLRSFFVQYLFAIFIGFLMIILIVTGLFWVSLQSGFIISVGDVEASIESQAAAIASAETVSADLIPNTCKYATVSAEGEFLSGNMTETEALTAWDAIQKGRRNSWGFLGTGIISDCYFPIERKDGFCIVEYSSLSQFSPVILREHLPAPEIVWVWVVICAFLVEIFMLSKIYGKKISRKLIPLENATKKIREKDLAFEIQYSGIEEIDSALQSLDSMKAELKHSLETQWKMEQTRKTQISALAHDLKTPLTVIRGNAEMLNDTEQTTEQKECTLYIQKNADQMEQYIQMLIDLSKVENGCPLKLESTATRAFLDGLYTQINALASMKQIRVETEEMNLPASLCMDAFQMFRAIINVASNAIDYSPERSTISFSISNDGQMISFQIVDAGKGFSSADLRNATNQFYQGDISRSSKSHYGMGLFIADSIVKQHGGILALKNVSSKAGGMVIIKIPIQPQSKK